MYVPLLGSPFIGDYFKVFFWIFEVLFSALLHRSPPDTTVLDDAGIEPRAVATLALACS